MLKRKKTRQKGSAEGIVILGIVLLSLFLGGGLFFNNIFKSAPPPVQPSICCDTGNGNNCKPQSGPGQTITFASPTSLTFPNLKNVPVQYDLLKSRTTIRECTKHMIDSGKTVTYPDGNVHPIVIDVADKLAGRAGECPDPGYDQLLDDRTIGGVTRHLCVEVPDDELIYVCVANCMAPFGNVLPNNDCDSKLSLSQFYGDERDGHPKTTFDVYFRDLDYPTPGVPDVIKNCQVALPLLSATPTPVTTPKAGNEQNSSLLFNPYAEHKTLQLHTFDFTQGGQPVDFPRDFCKPAVYLYPQQKETVHVTVDSKQPLTYTDPKYPANGWDVTAYPNGDLYYNNNLYSYLYYETAIPDDKVPQENFGYSVAYNELREFFQNTLPQLGLNSKEENQFSDYWLKALPYSNYYKITVIPQNDLDQISPLTILPNPDTRIRVTLNFEPLDKPVDILPPVISAVARKGFTAVEWGGLYKKDKNHPFTCLQ